MEEKKLFSPTLLILKVMPYFEQNELTPPLFKKTVAVVDVAAVVAAAVVALQLKLFFKFKSHFYVIMEMSENLKEQRIEIFF
jgi:hypothetical protein